MLYEVITDSDVSADGHRWLVNTYPNEWTETCTAASYGGNREFKFDSKAPGIYAMNGAAGAIYPEDYNEAGSMWDHLRITSYNVCYTKLLRKHRSGRQALILRDRCLMK